MAKARVLGRNTSIILMSQSLLAPLPLGEIDDFSANSQTEIIKSRPIGFTLTGTTHDYGGWELSFSGGKVDWNLAHYYWLQDQKLRQNKLPPSLMIVDTIVHYNGALEQYTYKDVVIYGFDKQASSCTEEVIESVRAFSPVRTLGPTDTTIIADPAGNALREYVMRTRNERTAETAREIERPF